MKKNMNDQQDGGQAMDRISKSRESCHPVKKPKRALSDMCGNKTIKRYGLRFYGLAAVQGRAM
jgi:hypothetical protein